MGDASETTLPQHFELYQNVPNPFNAQTQIGYGLPRDGLVQLQIYNAMGQHIRTLVEAHQGAGTYRLDWDGRDDGGVAVGSGVYFYRLAAPEVGFGQTRSMLLVR